MKLRIIQNKLLFPNQTHWYSRKKMRLYNNNRNSCLEQIVSIRFIYSSINTKLMLMRAIKYLLLKIGSLDMSLRKNQTTTQSKCRQKLRRT